VDLPTVYEMPAEAVNWVKRMLSYTVAGGKMNRGLSLMAVQQTLAAANGRTLTNKVFSFDLIKTFLFHIFTSGTLPICCFGLVC
jgi:hypothetical protein